jgi:opacity protein-like surface antigen
MRKFLVAAAMMAVAQGAEAADMPDLPILRGAMTDGLTSSRTIWHGYYAGVQAGTGQSDTNFAHSTDAVTAHLLNNTTLESTAAVSTWPLLSKQTARGTGYGAFAGYNSQWDDVVVGVEASYLHGKFGGSQTGSMERLVTMSATVNDDVISTSTSQMKISDYGTLRARAGYAVGSFLPYLFAGGAFGLADISRTSTVSGYHDYGLGKTNVAFGVSETNQQKSHLVTGYTAGLGVDVNLIGGLFMRAEWEYVRFTASVDTSINTVRAGLGYKF